MTAIANLIRGLLIGVAEVIPGVSGGTIALIVGVYERIIASAAAVSKLITLTIRGQFSKAATQWRHVDLKLLIPLLAGMVLAIFSAAALIEPLLESFPEIMRGLFFGMILISLLVPYRLATKSWKARDYLVGLLAALASFLLLSLPRTESSTPILPLVFFAAALAVCALVLPGVSGSFLLLAMGFYTPTLAAVNDRDFAYLGVFVLGAVIGLMAFSRALAWLLQNRHRLTLVLMTGLMLGSLRAIWPWQDAAGNLNPPSTLEPWFAMGSGAAVVGLIMLIESRIKKAQ